MGSQIDPKLAIGQVVEAAEPFTYTNRDVILYALGVGVSTSQEDHLKFLYENHEEFSVLPTFGVIPAFPCLAGAFTGTVPGLQVNPTMILHGEQYLELMKPLDTSGKLTVKSKISDIVDKGKAAIIYTDVDVFNEAGEKVAFNQFGTFVQRAGGFGGKRSSDVAKKSLDPPKRPPCASIQEKVGIDQPALYRLSGDRNPLHLDPDFAAMGGFSQPIAHGLCFFGMSARHVLKQFANNDVTKFKAIKVRFSKPVLPGQTIQTDMWKEGNRVFFQTKVIETGAISLAGAYVDLYGDDAAASTNCDEEKPQSDMLFEEVANRLKGDKSLVSRVGGIVVYNLQKDGKTFSTWTVDLKNNGGAIYKGEPKQGAKPDVTLTMSEETLIGLATQQINGTKAFLTGKVKLSGNIMMTQKLEQLFLEKAKL